MSVTVDPDRVVHEFRALCLEAYGGAKTDALDALGRLLRKALRRAAGGSKVEVDDLTTATIRADEVGRGHHDDALSFLAGLGLTGVPTAEVYEAALGPGTTGAPVDADLEARLRLGSALSEVAEFDLAPGADEQEYLAAVRAAAERLGVGEEF
jgi:hypothetical protein